MRSIIRLAVAAPCLAAALAAAAFAVATGSAVAAGLEGLTIHYEVNFDTNLRTLTVTGDEGANEIVASCISGVVAINGLTLNSTHTGQPLTCGGALGSVPVPGPQEIDLVGLGGNDRIDTSAVTPQAGFTQLVGAHGVTQVRLYGGPGADTLTGGPLGEYINEVDEEAQGGGDTINGNGGDDQIAGTPQADKISGGAGNDQIKPGGGADVVHAGPGDDGIDAEYTTGNGARYYGEGGRDIIFGGFGNDYMNGGPGADELLGNAGNDTLIGGPGKDLIDGGPGNDVLIGGPGNDYIKGGPGRNRISPGPQ